MIIFGYVTILMYSYINCIRHVSEEEEEEEEEKATRVYVGTHCSETTDESKMGSITKSQKVRILQLQTSTAIARSSIDQDTCTRDRESIFSKCSVAYPQLEDSCLTW
mmetsp:Transcript_9351/g.15499  ORF Transcript_9351/g.15499 Transcript_9351/m.15499 type:complete len:107 (-) Transcript_9351:1126-1446(-)